MKDDIYNYDRSITTELKRLEESDLSKYNKDTIKKYNRYLELSNYSKGRTLKYLNRLRVMAIIFKKDFNKINKYDIEKFILDIRKKKTKFGKEISEETKKDYLILFKIFFKWFKGFKGKEGEYPKEVSWIRTNFGKGKRKLPEDMLDDDDIKAMIENCNNLRDKAMISILYDSGLRIGELLSCKIKHVKFDNEYAVITCPSGKTGSRRILLIPSVPYLVNWIENHPLGNPEDWLIISTSNNNQFNRPSIAGINNILKDIGKKAGITKRISCHQFRHASATKSAKFMTDAQMKERFGWTQASTMASVYIHMSGRDCDDAVKKMYGKETKAEEIKEELKPKSCPYCETSNGFESKYCRKCGRVLSLEMAMEREQKQELILQFVKGIQQLQTIQQNPEFLDLIKNIKQS